MILAIIIFLTVASYIALYAAYIYHSTYTVEGIVDNITISNGVTCITINDKKFYIHPRNTDLPLMTVGEPYSILIAKDSRKILNVIAK